VENVANRFGSFIIISDAKDRPRPAGINPTRAPNWVLDINGVFPNYILDVVESGYFTYHVWPLAVDRSIWEVRAYERRPYSTIRQRPVRERAAALPPAIYHLVRPSRSPAMPGSASRKSSTGLSFATRSWKTGRPWSKRKPCWPRTRKPISCFRTRNCSSGMTTRFCKTS
jgi:hypothetical protein